MTPRPATTTRPRYTDGPPPREDPSAAVMSRLSELAQELSSLRRDVFTKLGSLEENLGERLRGVELWRARMEGFRAAYRWLPTVLTSLAAGAGSTVIALLVTGAIHSH